MADPRNLFKCAWGSCELWVSSVETAEGRDLVIQSYTNGNIPSIQNRGDTPPTVRVALIFDDIRGQKENGDDRLTHFRALKAAGKPQLFTHPLYGTYLAEIGEFTTTIDESSVVTGSATFHATEDNGAVTVYPQGISIDGGTQSISAAADALDAQLADVELTSPVSALARATATAFDAATSARAVLVQLSQSSAIANQAIDDLQTTSDIALWPVFKSLVVLGDAYRSTANFVNGDDGGLFTMVVNSPTSLRRLVQDISAGDPSNFDDYYQSALDLNDVSTPARIPPGTTLRLRRPTQAA